jgi:hypothetical protein
VQVLTISKSARECRGSRPCGERVFSGHNFLLFNPIL